MSRLRHALGLLEVCTRQLSHGSQLQPHTVLPLSSLPSALAPALPMSTSATASSTRGSEECSSSSSALRNSQVQGRGAPSYMHNHHSPTTRRATALSRAACSTLTPITLRGLHTSMPAAHGSSEGDSEETISVTFVDKNGNDQEVRAPLGKNLLEVAHDNEVDLEGACEGSLACSTCHVIVEDEEYYKKLPEPCDDELDMLDLAFDLKETSRLGCQIVAAKELDGLRVRLPSATRNFYVDGHKPKPH